MTIAPDSPASDPRPSPWRWWICGLLLLATTINYLDRVALNQTATEIKQALRLSNTDYSRLESGFVLAFGVGAIVTGIVVDRIGVRWVYPLAVLGWSAAGFLTGFAPTFLILLTCRVGLGLFESGNWPCGIRTVRQIMPPEERSLGVAIFQSGTGLGAMLTPIIVAACVLWVDPDLPRRTAHWALGGGPATAATGPSPETWQVPFRVIGLVGLGWVALWLLTVPSRALTTFSAPQAGAAGTAPFTDVFFDRRFWILVVLVVGVNTTWHTFRVWLPLFLREQLGYSATDMAAFTFAYYLTADVGSWLVGLTVLGLTRAGLGVFRSRLIVFAGGVALVLSSALLPFYRELGLNPTIAIIMVTGFGALGLFAAYFALSQEVSGTHQGKVTGTLSAVNAAYLAGVYEVQGRVSDALGGYDRILAVAGLPALAALMAVAFFWPRK